MIFMVSDEMMPTPRRKKWSEAEERTLIDRYGEMVCDGTLAKMKTREKRFRPIAMWVNSVHHVRDPVMYPWQWTWKDVSTKVQNMRHQYLLVKQKIKKVSEPVEGGVGTDDGFEWEDGDSHWSNFLRYKEVFGDVPLVYGSNGNVVVAVRDDDEKGGGGGGGGFDGSDRGIEIQVFRHFDESGFGAGNDCGEDGVMGLGFEYEVDGGEENYNDSNHLKDDGENGFVYEEVKGNGCDSKIKNTSNGDESRFEHHEVERERERQKGELLRNLHEKESKRRLEDRERDHWVERLKGREAVRKQRILEWESIEAESRERERKRREDMLIEEREWEERMDRRRVEWKKSMDDMLAHHREEMAQLHSRIIHEQQNMVNQLLGIVSQWSGQPTGLPDHAGASDHYLSQMMQNFHQVNDMVNDDTRAEGDNQEFTVDG